MRWTFITLAFVSLLSTVACFFALETLGDIEGRYSSATSRTLPLGPEPPPTYLHHTADPVAVLEADRQRNEYESKRNVNERLRDLAWNQRESEQNELHLIIKCVSIPYFLVAAGLMIVAYRRVNGMGKYWLAFMAVAGVFMAAWSVLLSGAISFDETAPAWIAASALVGLTAAGLCFVVPRAPAAHPNSAVAMIVAETGKQAP